MSDSNRIGDYLRARRELAPPGTVGAARLGLLSELVRTPEAPPSRDAGTA